MSRIATYDIQQWLFAIAHGRYDIDLAESGVQFLRVGHVKIERSWELDYSTDRGELATRRAVAATYGNTDPDSVIITHGAQEAMYLFYRSFLAPGDHVITTTPGWQQSWEVPRQIGCQVSMIQWTPGEPFDIETFTAAFTEKTRLVVLNSPGNPSGCALSEAEWEAILTVAHQHNVVLLVDEEYLLDFAQSVLHRYPRALSVSSLSKVYGLPGIRCGWAAGSCEIISEMVNYKRYVSVSNSLLCERIATQVLAERATYLERYDRILDRGRSILLEFSTAHNDHVDLVPPDGTPFAWLHLRDQRSSFDLATRLVERERVLVMPAEVFGSEHGIRVTYARSPDTLRVGLESVGRQIVAGWPEPGGRRTVTADQLIRAGRQQ